jgi:Fe-S-cluster containining protein
VSGDEAKVRAGPRGLPPSPGAFTLPRVRALRILRHRTDALSSRVERELTAILAGDTSPASLARAAEHAHALLDDAGARARSLVFTPACSAGCSYCCHVHVDVSAPEILALAVHLERTRTPPELDALRCRLALRARSVDPLTHEERWAARIPCALLGDDGRCSVYPARPLRCRAFHSCAVDPCRDAFAGRAGAEPVPSPALERAHEAVEEGYDRALAAAGISAEVQRLETGLLAALESRG